MMMTLMPMTTFQTRERGLPLAKMSWAPWADSMAEHCGPELGAHLKKGIGDLTHPFVLDVVCYLLPEWTRPGVLLIGDAAHPMSPVGGQGINIALRDALVAANHLVPVLEKVPDEAAIDAAARAVQAERYPEVAEIQRLQRVPPRFIFQRSWWARLLYQPPCPSRSSTGPNMWRRSATGIVA